MTLSTIERAYALARSGEAPDVARLKQRLKADGCRAVDALLAPRSIHEHLQAICAAAFRAPQVVRPQRAEEPADGPEAQLPVRTH